MVYTQTFEIKYWNAHEVLYKPVFLFNEAWTNISTHRYILFR